MCLPEPPELAQDRGGDVLLDVGELPCSNCMLIS